MINSTNTVNIDGVKFKQFELKNAFSNNENDRFSQWVVRPLAILAVIGLGVAALFTSVMLMVVSVALLPILALAIWAMKTKVERDMKQSTSEASVVVGAD